MPRLFAFWTPRRGFGLGLAAAIPALLWAIVILICCLLVAGVEVGRLLKLAGTL